MSDQVTKTEGTQAAEAGSAQASEMEEKIRQTVLAWLKDAFEGGKYTLGNNGSAAPSRDHYLEIRNTTNVDLRELRMQMEIYKDGIKVDQVTAKTGASGIRSGQTGRLTFFSKQQYFSALKILPDTVTYKADWIPEQVMQSQEPKTGLAFWKRKKKPQTSEAFRVGTGDLLKTRRNEYVQKLEALKTQSPDDQVRQGLENLIPIVEQIFQRVAEGPGTETEIKRLTDRYLPMIITSTESYLSYVKKDITGEDMDDLKEEVISGIGLVTEACGNLRNRLYEDGIVDASTDISVLKMLLQQDGLLDSEFGKK